MEAVSVQLKELILAAVVQTGKKLGSGAYGEVVEVRISGLKCAGKKLHDLFFDQSPPSEQRAIVSRFVEECMCLSKLRHPNIIQLIGVHFIRNTHLPMMVMELLPISLSQCLARHQQIPGNLKTSILYDISLGLLYLHSQTPPLIHRDLTANNVLLTTNMSAKLADLGVARIVNLNPAQLTTRMTQCPGALPYMPPEALSDRPQYDEKLEVFSFGNLILHVCTQQWRLPAPFLAYDPQNPGMPKPLTEVQRRQKYLDLIDKKNPLASLSERCLHNFPPQRPTTASIASDLEKIHKSSAASLPVFLAMAMENLTMREQKEEFDKTKKNLTDENKLLDEETKRLGEENKRLGEEIAQLRQKNLALKQQAHDKDEIIAQLRKEKPSASLAPVKRYSQPIRTIQCPVKPARAAITTNGDIIVTKWRDNCVIIFNKNGNEIRSFGGSGQVRQPTGVVITADSNILVVDNEHHHLQKFTLVGNYVTSVGSKGSGPLQFKYPCGVALHPSGKIFIAEQGGHCVQVLNPDLSYSHMFGSAGTAPGQFNYPWDVACDSQGMVYVADNQNHRIQKFTPDGKFVMMIGSKGSQAGELYILTAVAIDHMDRVYVADSGNDRVSVFTSEGTFIYCFGSKGDKDGEFRCPMGLAFDQDGHLYVCDYNNDRVVIY